MWDWDEVHGEQLGKAGQKCAGLDWGLSRVRAGLTWVGHCWAATLGEAGLKWLGQG